MLEMHFVLQELLYGLNVTRPPGTHACYNKHSNGSLKEADGGTESLVSNQNALCSPDLSHP